MIILVGEKGVAIALPFSSNSLRTLSILRSLYFISISLDFQAGLESKEVEMKKATKKVALRSHNVVSKGFKPLTF